VESAGGIQKLSQTETKKNRGAGGLKPVPRVVLKGGVGLLAAADQGFNDMRIGERGGVADLIDLVLGNLA
jgi:hypothetical protein